MEPKIGRRGFLQGLAVAGAAGESGRAVAAENRPPSASAVTRFSNKRIALFGDSLTAMGGDAGWRNKMQEMLQFGVEPTVYARDAYAWTSERAKFNPDAKWGVKGEYDDCVIWNQYNRFVREVEKGMAVPDYLFFMAGSNDAHFLKKVGQCPEYTVDISTYLDKNPTDMKTIADSIIYVIALCQKNFPTCKIVIATPPIQYRGHGYAPKEHKSLFPAMHEMAIVIKDVAKYLAIPCIDVYNECNINNYTCWTDLDSSGVHMRLNGANKLAACLTSGLNRYCF